MVSDTRMAAAKLRYLALRNIQKTWRAKPAQQRRAALPHVKLLFGDRMPDERYGP